MTAGLAVVVALSGCAGGPSPDVEPSVEPEPQPVETTIPIEEMEMPASLGPYESMSLAEFIALPIEERLPYIDWLTRDVEEVATLWQAVTGRAEDAYPGRITLESTDQAVLTSDIYALRAPFVTHFNVTGIKGSSVLYDGDTSQKILSAVWADTSYADYTMWSGELSEYFVKNDFVPNPTIAAESDVIGVSFAQARLTANHVETFNGREYRARSIPARSAIGENYTYTYLWVEYVGFDGEPTGKFVRLAR
jgi:hypothetical protein